MFATLEAVGDIVGTVADVWQIEGLVGRDGPVSSYRAHHRELNLRGIVRIFERVDFEVLSAWLERAAAYASADCPALPRAFDSGALSDGTPFLVAEEVTGESLAERLERRGALSRGEALAIAHQLASALAIVREHGVRRRPVGPDHLVLGAAGGRNGAIKLVGFEPWPGAGHHAGQKKAGSEYAPPELIRGAPDLDERTEVYMLAAVVYAALTGGPPYEGREPAYTLARITAPGGPSSMRSVDPTIPTELDELVLAGLAASPKDRPESLAAFMRRMEAVVREANQRALPTPTATIGLSRAFSTAWVSGAVDAPLWRGRTDMPDRVRFPGSRAGDPTLVLELAADRDRFFIGKSPSEYQGITNDLVLPDPTVSRAAAEIVRRNGRYYVKRTGRSKVWVGMSLLDPDGEAPLLHGRTIAVGKVPGVYLDGRYVPAQVPPNSIDEQTGLLGRDGLGWELALASRLSKPARLVMATETTAGAGDMAAAAMAIHAAFPRAPIARFEDCVAALLPPEVSLERVVELAQKAGAGDIRGGYRDLVVDRADAGIRLDEVRGALTRHARHAASDTMVDLGALGSTIRELDDFADDARELARLGGGIALLALEDTLRLAQMGDDMRSAVEDELLQLAGRVVGMGSVVARVCAGVIAIATPDPVQPVAQSIAAEWHARGPIRGDIVEVDRSVSVTPIAAHEVGELAQIANAIAAAVGGVGIEAMPSPVATRVRAVDRATDPIEKARLLGELVSTCRRLLDVFMHSLGRWWSPSAGGAPGSDAAAIDAGAQLGQTLNAMPGRIGELLRPLYARTGGAADVLDDAQRCAQQIAAGAGAPAEIDRAVGAVLGALRPLRGWTLMGVQRTESLDPLGQCETVHYVDYTGGYERGTARSASLLRTLRMGPYVYLARLGEGFVVPLEPEMRVRRSERTGHDQLYWVEGAVDEPGAYRYVPVDGGDAIEQDVTARQLGL